MIIRPNAQESQWFKPQHPDKCEGFCSKYETCMLKVLRFARKTCEEPKAMKEELWSK